MGQNITGPGRNTPAGGKMDYRRMTAEELHRLEFEAISRGNFNAAREISEFIEYFGKTVEVVKGRKVPKGVYGKCFWLKRYDNSKYGDPGGIYSSTRIGLKTEDGKTYFTSLDNVEIKEERYV